MSEMFTLREAQVRVDQIVNEIASLLGVVALDMESETGEKLDEIFNYRPDPKSSAWVQTSPEATEFARGLVERIIADGPLHFEWKEETDDHNNKPREEQ